MTIVPPLNSNNKAGIADELETPSSRGRAGYSLIADTMIQRGGC